MPIQRKVLAHGQSAEKRPCLCRDACRLVQYNYNRSPMLRCNTLPPRQLLYLHRNWTRCGTNRRTPVRQKSSKLSAPGSSTLTLTCDACLTTWRPASPRSPLLACLAHRRGRDTPAEQRDRSSEVRNTAEIKVCVHVLICRSLCAASTAATGQRTTLRHPVGSSPASWRRPVPHVHGQAKKIPRPAEYQ